MNDKFIELNKRRSEKYKEMLKKVEGMPYLQKIEIIQRLKKTEYIECSYCDDLVRWDNKKHFRKHYIKC